MDYLNLVMSIIVLASQGVLIRELKRSQSE